MTDDELVSVLLADYNEYRRKTRSFHELSQRFPVRDLKLTDERRELLLDVIKWCAERKLTPRQWVFGLFRVRNWIFPPKFTRGTLMTKNADLVEKIRKLSMSKVFQTRVVSTSAMAAKQEEETEEVRDLIHHVEARKAALASRDMHDFCFASFHETLGYHPRSSTCRACPRAGDCAVLLASKFSFDILSLRATAKDL